MRIEKWKMPLAVLALTAGCLSAGGADAQMRGHGGGPQAGIVAPRAQPSAPQPAQASGLQPQAAPEARVAEPQRPALQNQAAQQFNNERFRDRNRDWDRRRDRNSFSFGLYAPGFVGSYYNDDYYGSYPYTTTYNSPYGASCYNSYFGYYGYYYNGYCYQYPQ